MIARLALPFLLFAAPAVAQVEPWERYAKPWGDDDPKHQWWSEGGYHWFFDRDVQRRGTEVTVWLRQSFHEARPDGTVRLMSQVSFDCAGRYRYSAQTASRADGSETQSIDRLGEWTYIRPESHMEVFAEVLCR